MRREDSSCSVSKTHKQASMTVCPSLSLFHYCTCTLTHFPSTISYSSSLLLPHQDARVEVLLLHKTGVCGSGGDGNESLVRKAFSSLGNALLHSPPK